MARYLKMTHLSHALFWDCRWWSFLAFLYYHPLCHGQSNNPPHAITPHDEYNATSSQASDKEDNAYSSLHSDLPVSPFDRHCTVVHPSILAKILHPAMGTEPETAFALLSCNKEASLTIPLHVKLYYWANMHVGLSVKDTSSSLPAFRNCMYIKSSAVVHLSSLLNVSSVDVARHISFCATIIMDFTEGKWPVYFPPGTFALIPLGLRTTVAYRCSAERDPYHRKVFGTILVSEVLEQALYFEEVRMDTFFAFTQGFSSNYKRPLPPAELLKVRIPLHARLSGYAAAENVFWMEEYRGPHRDGRKAWIAALKWAVPDFEQRQNSFRNLVIEYWIILGSVMENQDGDESQEQLDTFRERLEFMIDRGLDINVLGHEVPYGLYNPIQIALLYGKIKLIQLLLEYGLNLNLQVGDVDALHTAAISQKVEMVHFLLEQGVYVRNSYYGTSSILHLAIKNHETPLELILLLIKYGANPMVKDIDGWTFLYRAAVHSCLPIVDHFIHEAKDSSELEKLTTRDGESLFLLACASSSPELILPYFLGGYAGPINLNDRTKKDRLACENLLVKRNRYALAKEIFRLRAAQSTSSFLSWSTPPSSINGGASGANTTYFYRACVISGDLKLLDILLIRGADIDERDDETHLPCLLHAVQKRQLSLFAFLIDRGASLSPVSGGDPSNLSMSDPHNSPNPSSVLSSWWQWWWHPLHHSNMPLVAAAEAGLAFVEVLVQGGLQRQIDVLASDYMVRSALVAAKVANRHEVVEYFTRILEERAGLPDKPDYPSFSSLDPITNETQ